MTGDTRDQRVLITGASSGIGEAIARELDGRVGELVLAARSADRLESLAGELTTPARPVPVDLASAAGVDLLLADVEELPVDILVNNAGIGLAGDFAGCDEARLLELLAVNVIALVRLTRGVLPAMIARGRGMILNVGSVAGVQGCPHMAAYGASKSLVNDFSEALASELRGTGVCAGALLPGTTRTPFFARASIPEERLGGISQSAQQVARVAVRQIQRGRAWCVSGALNRALVEVQRFLPRAAVRAIARRALAGLATAEDGSSADVRGEDGRSGMPR